MNEHFKQLLKHLLYYLITLLVVAFVVIEYQNYTAIKQQEITQRIEQERFKAQEANCLKNALYYEARSEGTVGILAVASVIENRKSHPDYPESYCAVIKQHKQFSYTLSGKPDVERIEHRLKAADKQAYGYVSQVADDMLEGQFKPILEHSVLWYATTSVRNYWTKTKAVVARVGKHVFYKDKK